MNIKCIDKEVKQEAENRTIKNLKSTVSKFSKSRNKVYNDIFIPVSNVICNNVRSILFNGIIDNCYIL
jgi:hypothetical protein